MLDTLGKNLWILLTVIMPGLFTFGVWRLLLVLEPSNRLWEKTLKPIDDSTLVMASVIVAVALLQQAIGIMIEALLYLVAKWRRRDWPHLHALLGQRFSLAAGGQLDENATRILGNCFLSINLCVGLALLLAYFVGLERRGFDEWIPRWLLLFLVAGLATAAFRLLNATWVVRACLAGPPGEAPPTAGVGEKE